MAEKTKQQKIEEMKKNMLENVSVVQDPPFSAADAVVDVTKSSRGKVQKKKALADSQPKIKVGDNTRELAKMIDTAVNSKIVEIVAQITKNARVCALVDALSKRKVISIKDDHTFHQLQEEVGSNTK